MRVVYPASDIQTTGWTPNAGASVYGVIDEPIVDDADYAVRDVDSHDTLILGLGSTVRGACRIGLRFGTNFAAASARARLMDDASAVVGTSTWQDVTATPTTYYFSVSASEPASRLAIEVVPDTTLLDENGDPLLTEGGEYILEG